MRKIDFNQDKSNNAIFVFRNSCIQSKKLEDIIVDKIKLVGKFLHLENLHKINGFQK